MRHAFGRAHTWWITTLVTILSLVAAALTATPAAALTGQTRLHDPTVIKVGSCHYAFSTGFENDSQNPSGSITIYRTCDSTAATGWTKVGNTWSSTPAWITQELGSTPPNIWAPDVNYFDGEYHLYYGASLWGTADAAMGLLTATNPAGPWTDRGMVTDVNYPIDPDVVRGGDGRLYVSWGSWTGGASYLHVLDEGTGKLSTSDHNLWRVATGVEGVSIVQDGGYFYMFGSKGACCSGTSSTYYTVVARATSVTGPYYDQAGQDIANGGGTVVMRGASPRVAAGGADVYADGSAKYLAYHYYDAANGGRETLDVRPLTFSGGWPVLGTALGRTDVVMQVQHSSMCLDVWEQSTQNNAAVNQGNCNGGANQGWRLVASGGAHQIVNVNSGKCLQPQGASTTAGAAMVQVDCAGVSAQRWTITPTVGAYASVRNAGSNLCLEVYGSSGTNGAAASQWSCNGGANQNWLRG
ncbi:RICIN domain-containing protein [Promicromonospora sp. NPDC023805]|uniref:RICIN domain-containing protein n=1 Tax=Promicromonospora sp. NPDC023805 TaxID=3154696 RepID=UPI0033C4C2B2